ncbi:MAG TPA: sulfatase [Acidobacteriaceae bacterium]|jgi:arylsulfatase A-like enzyme
MKEKSSSSRRTFLAGAAGATLASVLPRQANAASQMKAAAPATHVRKRPLNVLFLMSDDMRAELGCYGSRFHVHSPNIDKLASQGVRFDRNYCQFPLCNPSRSSLFTGRPPLKTRVLGNTDGVMKLHPEWITLPRLFRENGYTTLRAGKLFHAGLDDHNAWTDFYGDVESLHPTAEEKKIDVVRAQIPRPDGVLPTLAGDNQRAAHSDQLLVIDGDETKSGDGMVADLAIKFLRENKDKPFFIGCGFSKPHSPPEAPQRFYDFYDPSTITLPPDFADWPVVPKGFPQASIRMRNADLFIGRGASTEEARQVIRAYLASISWADYNLGRVVDELDKLGLRDNTLIVFVVDHGYQLGEKGKWSKAGSLFEPGTRVPLLIHMPGAQGNGRPCLRIVQSLNLYRTIAELANLKVPEEVEGHSMVSLLHDPRAAWEHPAFSIWSEDGSTIHGAAVRTERWRYAEYGKDASRGAMLLDPHADPMELTNVADDPQHAQERARLSKLIADYTANSGWAAG